MSDGANRDPMHGKTLKEMLSELVERFGWEELASKISINCFANDPSLDSSLKFLRKTPWARNKVEMVYRDSPGLEPLAKKRVAPRRDGLPPKINPWTGKPI